MCDGQNFKWLFVVVVGSDGLHAIQTSGGGGTIQYTQSQDGQPFFVPGECIFVDPNGFYFRNKCGHLNLFGKFPYT